MANRILKDFTALGQGRVDLSGWVSVTAGGVVGTSEKLGWTAAKTATGEYTLTLEDRWNEIVYIGATALKDGTTDLVVRPKTFSAASKSIVLQALTGTTPVNLDNKLLVHLIVRSSSVTR